MDWNSITDAPLFSKCVDNKVVEAKIVSVYDGDTVKAVFPLNGTLYKWNCRLTGIDTPEIRTSDKLQKKFGYEVRDFLRNKILNKVVTLKCQDLDKYGRLLAEIHIDDLNINQWLIDSGYAFAYDGGTKESWSSFLLKQQLDSLTS